MLSGHAGVASFKVVPPLSPYVTVSEDPVPTLSETLSVHPIAGVVAIDMDEYPV